MKFQLLLFSILLIASFSCQRKSEGSKEKSLQIKNTILADAETDPLLNRSKDDDAADDPAIWIHPKNREQSIIFGTDKKGGIVAYNLKGKLLSFYPVGKVNNIDIRQNISFGKDSIDLLACSNRSDNSITFFSIQNNGDLKALQKAVPVTMKEEVYGFCLGKDLLNNKLYAFVNSTKGTMEQWEINIPEEEIKAKLVRTLSFTGRTEGMFCDDEQQNLFICQEEYGIWSASIQPTSKEITLLNSSLIEKNKNLCKDIEGISVYKTSDNDGYLLASIQGNYSYAIFKRQHPHQYIGSFRIVDGTVDGAEETDGIDICNIALGKQYPKGILVVQDGFNYNGKEHLSQNFKIVDGRKVNTLIEKLERLHSN